MWTIKTIEAACRTWHCPPVCQAQTVVVEYGYDSDGSGDAFRRVTDRAEGPNAKPSYAYAELPDDLEEWPDAWNEPIRAKWISVKDAPVTAPTLMLGRDGMGPDADEEDFESWVAYVSEHIDEACGFTVEVDERDKSDVQRDMIVRATDDQRETIDAAKPDLWERWCAEGAVQPSLAPLMPRMRRVDGTLELLRAVIRQHEIAQHRWRAPDPDDADDPAAREGLLRAAVMLRGVRERLTADFIEQAAEALGLP